MKKFQFVPTFIPTLLILIIFPLFIALGIWQLNRADEKKEIDADVISAQNRQALNLNDSEANSLLNEIYRKASMTGTFDNQHQFLYDNRTYQGKPGFHVLTPLVLTNKQSENRSQKKSVAVLVNRGWIPYLGTRDNIPDISVSDKLVSLRGSIKDSGRSIVLKSDTNPDTNSYPRIIQAIVLDEFGKDLNYQFLPVIIELDKSSKNGFVRDWQPYYGSADKHNAYAVQWFSMAAILLFLYFKLHTRRVNT